MKPLQTICLVISIVTFIGCNQNDDPENPNVDYFPTKIVTEYNSEVDIPFNAEMTFEYDNQNRISKYTVSNSNSSSDYEVAYNGDGEIVTISHLRVSETSSEERVYLFQYYQGIIINIHKISSDPITNPNLTYDAELNRYMVQVSSFQGNSFGFDESGSLNYLSNGYFTAMFNQNERDGVFKNVDTNYFPIFYSLIFTNLNRGMYISGFLSNKEIESLSRTNGEIFRMVSNIRNQQDEIEQITYFDGTTSDVYATSNITYELRTIN